VPNTAKRRALIAPLVRISWTVRTKSHTRSVAISLGTPLLAILLLLGGVQSERMGKFARSVLVILGVSR
jgi:hypothetical protein